MAYKIIVLDREKCSGCRQCELVCSVRNAGVANPSRARVGVVKWEGEGFFLPMLCQQCLEPACAAACPKEAISRDEKTGARVVDYDLCIGCKMCVTACPFGAMSVDPAEEKVVKCQLCDGDPQCVRFCDAGALRFVPEATATVDRKRSAAARYSELMRRHGRPAAGA
jgi:Fe-S-cluster-containing hydrogenase component 2